MALKTTEINPGKGDKEILLRIARNTIRRMFSGKREEEKTAFRGWLNENHGAFVSLHNKSGELRGCMGRFKSEIPLYLLIQELTISAASKDHRFTPVKENEMDNLVIEISVLSPLKRIYSLEEIEGGKHGIYIRQGAQGGTFLPQVIMETGWDVETFVSRCSRDKAGLGPDGWKEAELYTYTADIFSEDHI